MAPGLAGAPAESLWAVADKPGRWFGGTQGREGKQARRCGGANLEEPFSSRENEDEDLPAETDVLQKRAIRNIYAHDIEFSERRRCQHEEHAPPSDVDTFWASLEIHLPTRLFGGAEGGERRGEGECEAYRIADGATRKSLRIQRLSCRNRPNAHRNRRR